MQLFFNRNTEPAIMGSVSACTPGVAPRVDGITMHRARVPPWQHFCLLFSFETEYSAWALRRHPHNQSVDRERERRSRLGNAFSMVGPHFLLRGEQA